MRNVILIVLTLLLLTNNPLFTQTSGDSTLHLVEMNDGNIFTGEILAQDSSVVQLQTTVYGNLFLPRLHIESISELRDDQVVDGQTWPDNPQAARYLWVPNGYGLKKGEGYYQNVWVLYNQASYGITDNFSLGAGVVPLFLFAGAPTPVFVTPKFSFPIVEDKINAGVGVLGGAIIGDDATTFGITYATTTFGNRNKNVNIGFGWAFADGEWADQPTLSLAAMLRVSEKFYLLTENYFIGTGNDENIYILSLGGRVLKQTWGLDFGLVLPVSQDFFDSIIAVPWLGFTIPIRGRK